MAHKTLINGTAYGIDGGKTLVSGTSYKVTNGKVLINGTAYDISFVLPPSALDLWSGFNSVINCITYADGYWVVGGRYAVNTGSGNARIAYATSLAGPWTTKDLWSGDGQYTCINSIAYANGNWVAGGHSGNQGGRIAYATSLTGAWTTKDLWSGDRDSNTDLTCVAYGNGYWVVGGERTLDDEHYACISYATTPSDTWTKKDFWEAYNMKCCVNCVTYANGYWVAGGVYSSTNSNKYGRIRYISSTPTGTWSTKDVWTRASNGIKCVAYGNGYWVVGGIYSASNASVAYATSPSGTWTRKQLWTAVDSGNGIHGITYANGYWVVAGSEYNSGRKTCISYATSPSGTWTKRDLWGGGTYDTLHCIAYANGYFAVGGTRHTSSTYYARISYADKPSNLPA